MTGSVKGSPRAANLREYRVTIGPTLFCKLVHVLRLYMYLMVGGGVRNTHIIHYVTLVRWPSSLGGKILDSNALYSINRKAGFVDGQC